MLKNKNNLKQKIKICLKNKLLLTIILITLSLTFLALSLNVLNFKTSDLMVNTMIDNHDYIYNVNKVSNDKTKRLSLQEDDIKTIKKNTNAILNNVYILNNLKFEFGLNNGNNNLYPSYLTKYLEFIEVQDNQLFSKIIGRIPNLPEEIVVHKFFADYCIKYGIKKIDNTLYFPKNYEEMINSKEKIKLGNTQVTIVGIIDDENPLLSKLGNEEQLENKKMDIYDGYTRKGYQILTKGLVDKLTKIDISQSKDKIVTKKLIGVKIYDDNKKTLSNVFDKLIYKNTVSEVGKGEQFIYSSDNNYTVLGNIVDTYNKYSNYIIIVGGIFILLTLLIFYLFINSNIKSLKKEIPKITKKELSKITKYLIFIIGITTWILAIIIYYIIAYNLNKMVYDKYYYTIKVITLNYSIFSILFGIITFISLVIYLLNKNKHFK